MNYPASYLKTAIVFSFSLLLAGSTYSVHAEPEKGKEANAEAKTLTIGSKAPDINVEHWLSNGEGKFKKVSTFEKDKVYVIEFWATWCGPCIASMPHIVETQKSYEKKGVQIVSVSTEELETVEKFLNRKVPNNKDEITFAELTKSYCLTTDPDNSTSKDYMDAAGRNGIPCAFIVGKTGVIEWIGHPMSMDDALASIVDNKWDREVFAMKYKQERDFEALVGEISVLANKKNIPDAIKLLKEHKVENNKELSAKKNEILVALLFQDKQFEEALTIVDDMLKKQPEDVIPLKFFKTRILLTMDGKQAQGLELAKSICEDKDVPSRAKINMVNQLSGGIINGVYKDDKFIATTKGIIENMIKASTGEEAVNLLINISAIATHENDNAKAISYLEKALAENKNPRINSFLENKLKNLKDDDETKKDKPEAGKPTTEKPPVKSESK